MGTGGIHIRTGGAIDRSWVLPLAPRLHDFGPPPWRPRAAMDAAVTAAIERGLVAPPSGSEVLVAEDDAGAPLGFVHIETARDYFTGEAHGHVSDLVVVPGVEGRGVGQALMHAAESWSRERGYRLLSLNVFGENRRARALYERLGYGDDTTKMIKELGPLSP